MKSKKMKSFYQWQQEMFCRYDIMPSWWWQHGEQEKAYEEYVKVYKMIEEEAKWHSPKVDKRYLYKRKGGSIWWVKFRVPGTNKTVRKSLKTKDLREAQARRDKLLEQRKQLVEQTSYATQ